MDYEAIDQDMSSWVVSTFYKGWTRFYLTDEGLGTDILSRAQRYRWIDQAEEAAHAAKQEYAWHGFDWAPRSVAESMGD